MPTLALWYLQFAGNDNKISDFFFFFIEVNNVGMWNEGNQVKYYHY